MKSWSKTAAWPESSSLAAALSSAVAEFVWTTDEIWSIPTVIWEIEFACSAEAAEIFSTTVTISSFLVITELKASAVSWAILEPFSTALIEFSIRAAVFLDDSALLLANFLN